MPYDIDTEPIVITVPAQTTAPEGNVTAAEWTDFKNRVVAIEGLGLVDLSDVDLAGLTNGMTLHWDSGAGMWKPAAPALTISTQSNSTANNFGPVSVFDFRTGLQVTQHPTVPTLALVTPLYGTAANTVAMGSHAHSLPGDIRLLVPASGSLSSSSRTLVSGSRSGLDPARTYRVTAELRGDLQGQGSGAGYTTVSITIHTTTEMRFQRVRTVAGVPREYSVSHTGVEVSGVSSVAVSATISWSEGDPIDVQAGELVIRARANR